MSAHIPSSRKPHKTDSPAATDSSALPVSKSRSPHRSALSLAVFCAPPRLGRHRATVNSAERRKPAIDFARQLCLLNYLFSSTPHFQHSPLLLLNCQKNPQPPEVTVQEINVTSPARSDRPTQKVHFELSLGQTHPPASTSLSLSLSLSGPCVSASANHHQSTHTALCCKALNLHPSLPLTTRLPPTSRHIHLCLGASPRYFCRPS